MTTTRQQLHKLIIDWMGEDKDTGKNTYCKTCSGHIAAGECNCIGYNQALSELREKTPELVEKILKELNNRGYHRDCEIICKK